MQDRVIARPGERQELAGKGQAAAPGGQGLAGTANVAGIPPTPAEHGGDMEAEVERAAELAARTGGLGQPGRPLNRRSPFFIGMAAAAGVAITVGLAELVIRAGPVLILIGLALFIAAGLEPAVGWLAAHRVPRWAAVAAILATAAGICAGFLALAIPPLAAETATLIHDLPHYLGSLQSHSSWIGRLNIRYHLAERLTKALSHPSGSLVGGVLGAGRVVLSTVTSLVAVAALVVYFLAAMPRIRLFAYRLAPQSRRARVILLGDEIFTKVGGFLLGNIVTSLIAGLGTYAWMLAWGIPYPLLLGLFVALADLIPVIGSTIGGLVVSLIALTVSVPVALATLAFYVGYRLAEDYLLVPRVMRHTVQVPAALSLVAVLLGGALMGIVGALVAIPTAAVVRMLLDEIVFRRLDAS